MKKLLWTTALLFGLGGANIALAECEKPEPPAIPDGEDASGSDMLAAKKAVEEYLAAGEAYLECARTSARRDRMMNEIETIAAEFNRELRLYKARS